MSDFTAPSSELGGTYGSWGRLAANRRRVAWPASFAGQLETAPNGVLPYGNGRSYGDSCLNDEGVLLDTRRANRILDFDPVAGRLTAEAGILLADITRYVAPSGWFLPVTPGTQFVTLGGAIANDVHGKNHHRRGTFGLHVEGLELQRSDRGVLTCSPSENADLYHATVAGMGLTGLIRQATIRLLKVPSLSIVQTIRRFETIGEYFSMAEEADARHEYAVAWIDSLASGARFGRGHLMLGDHATEGDRSGLARRPIASVPIAPPISPLSRVPLKIFNELVFRKARRGESTSRTRFDAFFYPLDRIGDWNRLYGRRGLVQHQSVVPFGTGEAAVRELIRCAASHGQGSFLTVLKRFGARQSPGILSFPREGFTLTLDFPNHGPRTLDLLKDLDRITLDAGGAVNPYKDARMSPATFEASFPRWREVEALRDPAIVSDFWKRTALRLKPEASE